MRPARHRSWSPAALRIVGALALASCTLDRNGESGSGDAVPTATGVGGSASSSTTGASASSGEDVSDASAGSGAAPGSGGASSAETTSTGGEGGSIVSSSAVSSSSASASATGTGGADPVCGNGDEEDGEQCDDGDSIAGDRCGPTCLDENPDACPGTPIDLAPGTLVIADSTQGADDTFQDTQGAGSCAGTWPGADLIYHVVPSAPGTLRATLDAEYARHFLLVSATCPGSDDSALDCDYGNSASSDDTVELSVQPGSSYFVVVDSYDSTEGAFVLTLSLE